MSFNTCLHNLLRQKQALRGLIVLVLAFLVILPVYAQDTTLILTKTIDGGSEEADVGQIIRYRLRFACSSLVTPCGALEIIDELADNVTYVAAESSIPAGFSLVYDGGTNTITITKDNPTTTPFLDGTQFDAVIAVRVNYDYDPDNDEIENAASGRIQPGGQPWSPVVISTAPDIEIRPPVMDWDVTKSQVSPDIEPALDSDVIYQINACPVGAVGNMALSNITVVDTLPPNALLISAGGGVYDAGAGTVTWTEAGPVVPPDCVSRTIVIQYPSTHFSEGDPIQNTATVNATYSNNGGGTTTGVIGTGETPDDDEIFPPTSNVNYNKSVSGNPVGNTGTGRFSLNLDTRISNAPNQGVILHDVMPPQLEITNITSGTWSNTPIPVEATVEYFDGSTWTLLSVIDGSDISWAAPANNIQELRWTFQYQDTATLAWMDGLPPGWSFTTSPEIRFIPRSGHPTLPDAVAGNTYTNCLRVDWVDPQGMPRNEACNNRNVTIQSDFASVNVSKNETPGGSYDPLISDVENIDMFTSDATLLANDMVRYTITVELTERSSADLINPFIQDILPIQLEYMGTGNIYLDGVPYTGAVDFDDSNLPTLTWDFDGLTITRPTLGSRSLTVEFYARVVPGTLPGAYSNQLNFVSDTPGSQGMRCESGDPLLTDGSDIDGDGITGEARCNGNDSFEVELSAALRGEKWIRSTHSSNAQILNSTTMLPDATCPENNHAGLGSSANPFTRFPCISQAFPEGALGLNEFVPPPADNTLDDFEYSLRVFNDGNAPMVEYVLYDVLPYVGDNGSGGALANSARASQFATVLRGPIEFISGPAGVTAGQFTISYNTSENACRPEVFDMATGTPNVPASCDNGWVAAGAVAEWSSIRTFRILLNANQSIPQSSTDPVVFSVPMSIPSDQGQPGRISWNSFAHVGAYLANVADPASARHLLASEPRKVGITVPVRMSIGNRVWRDADNSGTINPPDNANPGIPGVTVNLYSAYDPAQPPVFITSTTTDANGYYLFSNIPVRSVAPGEPNPNNYVIGIPASNFVSGQPLHNLRSSTGAGAIPVTDYTAPPAGTADSDDNGIDPATYGNEVFSAPFELTPTGMPTGETISNIANSEDTYGAYGRGFNAETDRASNLTVDFGFYNNENRFSIGNHVWLDNGTGTNLNNGVMDGDEIGAVGVRVELYRDGNSDGIPQENERMRYDITDALGFYLFDELDPGNYFVVVAASNFTPGGALAGWHSSTGAGGEYVNPLIGVIDRDDNGIDSLTPAATIPGEASGIRSAMIVLDVSTATPTGETDLSGHNTPGTNEHNQTNWDGPGSMGRFGETDDRSNLTVDFGFIPPLSIGNRVWHDNGTAATPSGIDLTLFDDGLFNGLEEGIEDVDLTLFRENTPGIFTAYRTTTTDDDGYYLFDGLPPGNYQVRVDASNFAAGGALQHLRSSTGVNNAQDMDNNDNGIDDAGYLSNGIRSTTFNLTYRDQPLQTGSPADEIDIPGSGYGANGRGVNGEEDRNSNLTLDFGFLAAYSLGNRVWLDNNNNGQIDGSEAGIDGITVNLLRNNVVIATTTTAAGGYYRFDNLPSGDYMVEIADTNFAAGNPLEGRLSSTPTVANPNTDTDHDDNGINPATPGLAVRSGTVTLGSDANEPTGEPHPGAGVPAPEVPDNYENLTVDFGFYDIYSLGNYVWLDDNNSGHVDGDDGANPGIANVTVRLLDNTGSPVDDPLNPGTPYTTTTDTSGYYRFDYLSAGDYIVEIVAANFNSGNPLFGHASSTGSNTEDDPNTDGDNNDNGLNLPVSGAIRSGVVTLGNNAEPTSESPVSSVAPVTVDNRENLTVDFGFYPAYSLGNIVWLDNGAGTPANNDNGTMDTGETGISGVEVRLLDGTGAPVNHPQTGVPYVVTTNAQGYYRFDNLPAGNYIVELTAANFETGGLLESAVSSSDTSAGAEADPNLNGDQNDNGLDNPAPQQAIRSGMVTLGPGNVEPTGETPDPGVAPVTVENRENLTVDFGIVPRYSLGNRVWMDDGAGGGTASNGIHDGGEAGIGGVVVNLLDSTGAPVDNPLTPGTPYTTTTDADGYYRFDNLPAGDYIVSIPDTNFSSGTLQGTASTIPTVANPNTDADRDDNGIDPAIPGMEVYSGVVTLGPGYNEPTGETDLSPTDQGAVDDWANMTVDFGFVRLFNLGNRVWRDDGTGGGIHNDGIQNGGEPGIFGVQVRLLDSTGNPVNNTMTGVPYVVTTSAQGYYRFDNLYPGDYIVEVMAGNFTSGVLVDFFSSTGAGQEANPNTNGDQNDNGLDTPVVGAIRSGVVTLGALADEPTGEVAPLGQGGADNVSNMTVDFGFVPGGYSLGNLVWLDNGAGANTDNGIFDADEAGIAGVTVRLLNTGGTLIATTITDAGGFYRFDNLAAGNYVVEIAALNFGSTQPLFGLSSSTGAETNPNLNGDNNDNGIDTPIVGAIRSGTVTLGPGDAEPLAETPVSGVPPTAPDGRENLTVDFGFVAPANTYSLGNRVWFDANNDGRIDPVDGPIPGINGVVVNLLNPGGALIATTTTADGGYYLFDDLPPGDYIVEIAASNFNTGNQLFNRVSSSGIYQEANPNTDGDSNDNGLDTPVAGAIRSGTVTLGPGNSEPIGETDLGSAGQGTDSNGDPIPDARGNMTVDFGFTNPTNVYSLGNRVWLDTDNNGLHDAGEPGIAGVTVELRDSTGNSVVSTTVTDVDGYYRFDNLPAGNYIVQVVATNFDTGNPLSGLTSSRGAGQEANPNNDVDRNDNGLDTPVAGAIRSGTVTLGPGTSEPTGETDLASDGQGAPDNRANMTVDFGFIESYSLGNRVWRDTDNNGQHDAGEPGQDGVTVNLLNNSGTVIATTTTTNGGYYRFDDLPPGDYVVEIAASNFGVGQPLNGTISSTGAEADPNTDGDENDNGVDVPVAGAIRSGTVTLGGATPEPTGEDADPSNPSVVPDDRENLTVDFGFFTPTDTYSLGNRVWLDDGTVGGTANDGFQNGGEFGLVGVEVNLYVDNNSDGIPDGPIIATTTTDAQGYYRFDNLPAGNYVVEIAAVNFAVARPLNGLISTLTTEANPNSDGDQNDNGIDAAPGQPVRSGTVTLGPGDTEPIGETDLSSTGQGAADERANMTVDFGFIRPSTTYNLGNRVWRDDDNNGQHDPGEPGIDGVLVRLLDSTGTTEIATTITGNGGYYRFDDLPPGDYIVEIDRTNFTPGGQLDGLASSTGDNNNPTADENDNGIDTFVNDAIRSGIVTLGPGMPTGEDADPSNPSVVPDDQENLTIDFGFTASYSLGNRVWFDTNNNSQRNSGEQGIAGVTVELYRDTNGDGVYTPGTDLLINTVTTDSTGYYLFTGLTAADYVVVIPASNFGGVLNGYHSSGTTLDLMGVRNETAAPDPDNDIDDDDNGTWDTAGYVASTAVTIGTGNSEPIGEVDTTSATFPDSTADDRSNLTVDFGFYTMSLGNLVWMDADDSGLVNGTEAGIPGVTLELYPADPAYSGAPLATTTTNSSGQYTFTGLAEGEYVVRIPASNFSGVLSGLSSSTGSGAYEPVPHDPNDGIDNDDNGAHINPSSLVSAVQSAPIQLTPGGTGATSDPVTGRTTNNTLDFGMRSSTPLVYSLGNRVWFDTNNNGLHDAGEPGIGGVEVHLLDTSLIAVDVPGVPGTPYVVTTDAAGYYRFDNLPAGDYIVRIIESNFAPGAPLETLNSSTPDELLPNSDVDRNDNGVGITPIPTRGIESGVVTLGGATPEPTGETDLGLGAQGTVDNRANMTVDFGFTPPVGLIITKDDGLSAVIAGQETTYIITVYNNTETDLTDVVLTDTFPTTPPNGFDPSTITWTCAASGGAACPATSGTGNLDAVNATIGNMPDGSQVVYNATGRVYPCTTGCAGNLVNTATVEANGVSPVSDTDTNGIIFDPPRGVKVGTVLSDTLLHWEMVWLSTTDPAVGQTVVITDTIQSGQTFAGNLSCTPSGATTTISCGISGNTIRWEGTIFGGNTNRLVIGFNVTVPGNGNYNNTATLTLPGSNVSVTTAATVEIVDGQGSSTPGGSGEKVCPVLTIGVSSPIAIPGTPIDWIISTGNPTSNPMDNAIITIPLPNELELLEIIAPPDAIVTITDGVITIVIPSMPPGAYPDIIIRTRIRSNIQSLNITLTATMNYCASASASVTTVTRLPDTGETRPVSGATLLFITMISTAGLALVFLRWRRSLAL